ncbi:restriction endonuclease [Pseudofrankia inefficax]|uniref:Restriction endonuclease type IV Mrr domain-containing protein n=1 Tax=Pseudofrankia inefficax (strain DSM 45817 / CECT 9037 / DDB 130130 / EuI1c) TaxID=298654 RepID=E3J629_PSEI1|nr:restriction endonuclease [Pseudofrankia inefficax]ADP78320.1 hypothetical protein FraEuI1c_0233 [Pseudofrankia inefficax]
MLEKPAILRRLIARYGALRELDGYTPQSRGVEFNRLLAEVLDCYGISAKSSVRGQGEIDVAFSINGTRFILEAKWEEEKTDYGKIAKLQGRVRQRLVTTVGVFASMSGYTDDALSIGIGGRLDVLLLDRRHLEAMISGVVPPDELFDLLIDKTSYEGGVFHDLEDLFPSPAGDPQLKFGCPDDLQGRLVRSAREGITAEVVAHDLPMSYFGMALDSAGRLILNYPEGLVRVDLERGRARWMAPFTKCYLHVLPTAAGDILFGRMYGVGSLSGGRLRALAGGFAGNAILFSDDEGHARALDNGGVRDWSPEFPGEANVSLALIGENLGDERWTATDVPGATVGGATWAHSGKVAAVGSSALEMIDAASGARTSFQHDLTNTFSVVSYDDNRVLVVADGRSLAVIDVAAKTSTVLLELELNGSVSELSRASGEVFYLLSTYGEGPTKQPRAIVVRISLPSALTV